MEKLQKWEALKIKGAFDKYFGLRSGVSNPDDYLRGLFIEATAEKTGMRIDFLQKHLKEIQAL